MILELDAGNTRLKWRLLDTAGQRLDAGTLMMSDEQALSVVRERGNRAGHIRIASVAGAEFDQRLRDWWQCAERQLDFAQARQQAAGVTNAYAEPSSMGVDRWLAMLAGFHRAGGACMVIDCGSAITVDLVDAAGCHRGGYIVPGLLMLERALLSGTQGVRFDRATEALATRPGRSTAEAVCHGTLFMASAWLSRCQLLCQELCGSAAKYYITGGDAERLIGLLDQHCELVPDLVLDGLVWA